MNGNRQKNARQDASPFDHRQQEPQPYGRQPSGYSPYASRPQGGYFQQPQTQYTSAYIRDPRDYAANNPHQEQCGSTPAERSVKDRQTEEQDAPNKRRAHRPRTRRRRTSIIGMLLMIIGLMTVIVVVVRFLIVPLLVYLNSLGGGAG